MIENSTIAAMPFYTNLDRVARGLSALGFGPKYPIPPDQLFALSRHRGCSRAERLGLGSASRVLDIGSGVGVPRREEADTSVPLRGRAPRSSGSPG
jgi:hypothetical protein